MSEKFKVGDIVRVLPYDEDYPPFIAIVLITIKDDEYGDAFYCRDGSGEVEDYKVNRASLVARASEDAEEGDKIYIGAYYRSNFWEKLNQADIIFAEIPERYLEGEE